MQADYVIVGAGSAGCVLAARLSEDPSLSVCLIEAGPVDRSPAIHCPAGMSALVPRRSDLNWAFETVGQPGLNGRQAYQPRGRGLGGSSSINAMVYTRGHPADYDDWAALGNSGWGYADVLPYFLRAEHNERGASAHRGTGGPLNVADLRDPHRASLAFVAAAREAGYAVNPDFNGPVQEGFGLYQVTQKNGRRHSAARAYLAAALERPNLRVLTASHALKLMLEGQRAIGVECRGPHGLFQVRARREVVLSAGALQSPQLLMLSGIGPGTELRRHGIAVQHELPGVGRNLQDHIDYIAPFESDANDLFGLTVRQLLRLPRMLRDYRRHGRGLLTTNFSEAGGFARTRLELERPDVQFHFLPALAEDHGRRRAWGRYGVSCHVCVLRPKSVGSVTLSGADPLAAPSIDPNFLSHEDDVKTLVAGYRIVRRIMAQPALSRFVKREVYPAPPDDDALVELIRRRADSIYHPVGTCRMGRDAQAVVDASLRVHGLQGLRVVDASVMPTLVAGNTNAPTIMIAEKAADLIQGERS